MHTILIRWARTREELVRKIGRTAIRIGRQAVATTMYQGSTQHAPGTTVHAWTIGGGWIAEVRLTFDEPAAATYLSVQSVEAEKEREVTERFAERLEAVSVAEALEDVKQTGGRDSQAYLRLALACGGEYDKAVKEVIAESLGSQQQSRRRGAAQAIGILLWPEFQNDVAEALKFETDEANRALLTVAHRQWAS